MVVEDGPRGDGGFFMYWVQGGKIPGVFGVGDVATHEWYFGPHIQ